MEKGNKSSIIIIILCVLIILGLIGFICYDKGVFGKKENSRNSNTENKTEISEKDNNNEVLKNKTINFDKTKCINCNLKNYNVERLGTSHSISGLNFSIDSQDEKKVKVSARYDIIFPGKYSDEEVRNGSVKYYDDIDLNFNKKVEFIFGGVFGPDINGIVFIFLFEDGSLEYMKFSDIYNSQKYEHHAIDDISEIVRFDNVFLREKQQVAGGKHTAIAYKIDGTYYDLSEFIKF